MAQRRLALRELVLLTCCTLIRHATSTPEIVFPFNSQVPTVARVGRPYSFQLSSSTFAPLGTNFTYSISGGPLWLELDSTTRSLSGTPSQTDVGAPTFTISAGDDSGTAHMTCTLVVSASPPPRLEGDIPKEFAATVNLSSIQPPAATFLPFTPFHFQFQQTSFIDIVKRQIFYYSTLTDHTPLPAWLQFDPETLTYSGTTPSLSAFPQTWSIELIVSDVAGFAGTTVPFTITISTHQMVFVPEQVSINITSGVRVNFTGLQDKLFRNSLHLEMAQLKSAQATVPKWLSFDSKTLTLSGTPPAGVQDTNCTITVQDELGDQATAIVSLVVAQKSIFDGSVGVLIAHAGQDFTYRLPSKLFKESPVDLGLTFPTTAKWLHFDPASRVLSGQTPSQTTASSIKATLVARSSAESRDQTQTFTIDIVPSKTTTKASHAATSGSRPTQQLSKDRSTSSPNSGIIAAVVLGILLATALIAAFVYFLRQRRARKLLGEPADETKRTISRPILSVDQDAITVTTEVQRDVEKASGTDLVTVEEDESEQPPRIGLDLGLERRSRIMRWTKQFSRLSQASSLGNGEEAIRRDTNIPILGGESMAAHTPHHSFSVSTEMARASVPPAELSPRKRALRRVRAKLPGKRTLGPGVGTEDPAEVPRPRSENCIVPQRTASSVAASAAARSSVASFSTRGTSVLSAMPSDFPRPPARSGWPTRGARLGMARDGMRGRKSIRVVNRSDSITDEKDERPMDEKRQSFIRNRASTGIASPLFSHGSRLSTGVRQSMILGTRRSRRGISGLSTYSKSSSIEPPVRPSQSSLPKGRYAFAPNFPRALTRSTIGAGNDGNRDSSSFYTTDDESEPEYIAEMHLPRHQRSWVVPGEASPTPPPAALRSSLASRVRGSTPPSTKSNRPRARWEERLRERSGYPIPLATADSSFGVVPGKGKTTVRSRLSEPLSLVSNDSLSRAKQLRPRLVHTSSSNRPISVEHPRQMSSFQGAPVTGDDNTRPGSEMFEALESAGLMPPGPAEGSRGAASQRSNASGPAFL